MKERNLFIVSAFAISAFVLFPYLYLGTNAYITIHDVLDCEFIALHVLKISGLLFSFNGDTVVPNVMNGLPRSFFHSEFSIIRLLFYLFPSFWAYVINSVLVRIIGFAGMYLFAKDYLIKGSNTKIIIAFAALFSIVPLYTALYGLSVMGQPIIIWAFLNLSKGVKKFANWIIIILFPFYSHFAMIAIFILIALAAFGIYKLAVKQRISSYYFLGLGLLFCCFVAANYITLQSFLFPGDNISVRTEWLTKPNTLKDGMKLLIQTFTNGDSHSSSFKMLPIFVFCILSLFFVKNERRKIILMSAPIILIVVISLFAAIIYPQIRQAMYNYLHIPIGFSLDRFTFLIPMLWFIVLGFTLSNTYNKIHPAFLYFAIIFQSFFVFFRNEELKVNYAKVFHSSGHEAKNPGFNSFYSPELFSDIDKFINRPKRDFRVVSLGIHPSIAQYNGFYTLDSYQTQYLLRYKHEFRKIIENELNKDQIIKEYYDNWGLRCYLFSAELGNVWYRIEEANSWNKSYLINNNIQVRNLDINTDVLRKMGCEYIFSAVPIINHDELRLNFLKEFSNKDAQWDIYLYKL